MSDQSIDPAAILSSVEEWFQVSRNLLSLEQDPPELAGQATNDESDPVKEFDRQVRAKMAAGLERRPAIRAVVRGDPELHRRYLKATNPPEAHSRIDERAVLIKLYAVSKELAGVAENQGVESTDLVILARTYNCTIDEWWEVWKKAQVVVERLRVKIEQAGAPPPLDDPLAVRLEQVVDDIGTRVVTIASGANLTLDQKMRAIARLDTRFYGYTSPRWSNLLGLTASAIRQTDFWQKDRVAFRDEQKAAQAARAEDWRDQADSAD